MNKQNPQELEAANQKPNKSQSFKELMLQKKHSSLKLRQQQSILPQPQKKENILRDHLLMEVCENNTEMLEKLKKRFINEKKKYEDKIVTQRLQTKIQMRSLFSSKNLSALSPRLGTSGVYQYIPRRSTSSYASAVSSSDDDNKKYSGMDLDQFVQMQNNKINVASKVKHTSRNSSLIINEYQSDSLMLEDPKEISVENLDPSLQGISPIPTSQLPEWKDEDINKLSYTNKEDIVKDIIYTEVQPLSKIDQALKKRRLDIHKLKISQGDKIRLNKRSEIIRSMKFIRKLGKKLRQELEEQKEAILKFKKNQQKKLKNEQKTQKHNKRINSMKQIQFANQLTLSKYKSLKSHQQSTDNLIKKHKNKNILTKSQDISNKLKQNKNTETQNSIAKLSGPPYHITTPSNIDEVPFYDMLNSTKKKLSEISLSHSSSQLSSSQQENALFRQPSFQQEASLNMLISNKTTPRLLQSVSNNRDSLIERDLSIDYQSSNHIQKINLFRAQPPKVEDLKSEDEEVYYAEDTSEELKSSFEEFSTNQSRKSDSGLKMSRGGLEQELIQPSQLLLTYKKSSSFEQRQQTMAEVLLTDQFQSLKLSKFRNNCQTPNATSQGQGSDNQDFLEQAQCPIIIEKKSTNTLTDENQEPEIIEASYSDHLQIQKIHYQSIKHRMNQTLTSISEENSQYTSTMLEDSTIESKMLQQKQSSMVIVDEEPNTIQKLVLFDRKVKRNNTTDISNSNQMKEIKIPQVTPNSSKSSNNFIIEEASEHTITSQYSGKQMSQVIFKKLSPSKFMSMQSFHQIAESPEIDQSHTNDQGVQASPMTSLGESSELADSYDSDANIIFKPQEVDLTRPPKKKELEQEELESDSYSIQNSIVSSEISMDSNEIHQSSSSQFKSESESLSSISADIKAKKQKQSFMVTNKNKKDELKITFEPMMMRNDIENVDDLSDLEEFYLTEIEQQQNHDLIEKLNFQGQVIQDQIRQQQIVHNNLIKTDKKIQRLQTIKEIKEESDKLQELKVKMQRHETKKQIFSFNMYRMRQISDHDMFKNAEEMQQSTIDLQMTQMCKSNLNSHCSTHKLAEQYRVEQTNSFKKLKLLRQANSTVNLAFISRFDGQKSTKDLGSKSRGSSGSLLQSIQLRNLQNFRDRQLSLRHDFGNLMNLKDDEEEPNQLSVSSPSSHSLSSQALKSLKSKNATFKKALSTLKISARNIRNNVIQEEKILGSQEATMVVSKLEKSSILNSDEITNELKTNCKQLRIHFTKSLTYEEQSDQKKSSIIFQPSQSSFKLDDSSDIQPSLKNVKGNQNKSFQDSDDPSSPFSLDPTKINPLILNLNTNSSEISPTIKNFDYSMDKVKVFDLFQKYRVRDNETINENSSDKQLTSNNQGQSQEQEEEHKQIQSPQFQEVQQVQEVQNVPQDAHRIVRKETFDKNDLFQTSSTVGRRGHQQSRQQKQSSVQGDTLNNNNIQISTVNYGLISGGHQSSRSSIQIQQVITEPSPTMEYSQNTFRDSSLGQKKTAQPSPQFIQPVPLSTFTFQVSLISRQKPPFHTRPSLVESRESRSTSPMSKNAAQQRLNTVEGLNNHEKNKSSYQKIKLFSPKNKQVNKVKAMRQVRNNLKDLFEDVESRSKGGMLSPKNEQVIYNNEFRNNNNRISISGWDSKVVSRNNTQQNVESPSIELSVRSRYKKRISNPNRVTFGPNQMQASEKKPQNLNLEMKKSRNRINHQFKTTNSSIIIMSPQSTGDQNQFIPKPPKLNTMQSYGQHAFNVFTPQHQSQNIFSSNVSEIHQNFMNYNSSTESLQNHKPSIESVHKRSNTSLHKRSITSNSCFKQFNQFEKKNVSRNSKQLGSMQISIPQYDYIPKTRMYPKYQGY